jgi:hypothetical protein
MKKRLNDILNYIAIILGIFAITAIIFGIIRFILST